jgi:hypothetical protein
LTGFDPATGSGKAQRPWRASQAELEQLKNEVSVQRLVEASGVELKKGGKDLIGKCPFHEDEKARRRADRLGDQEQGRELPARH